MQKSKEIRRITRSLSITPYDPASWLRRSELLLQLGYAGLAAGDAHKARLLAKVNLDMFRGKPNALGKAIAPSRSRPLINKLSFNHPANVMLHLNAILLLTQAVHSAEDFTAAQQICNEGRETYPGAVQFKRLSEILAESSEKYVQSIKQHFSDPLEIQRISRIGWVSYHQYPFVAAEDISLRINAISAAQKSFEFLSAPCFVAPRNFLDSSDPNNSMSFGVFAKSHISSRQSIFEDHTIFGSSNSTTSVASSTGGRQVCDHCCGSILPGSDELVMSNCCSTVYCSEHCHSMAMTFYHQPLCNKSFGWLFDPAKDAKGSDRIVDGLIWPRVLATCVHNCCHPLEHPRIASLVPQLGMAAWNYREIIVQPLAVLQQLGVDIFQDTRYETWVLHSVWSRIITHRTKSTARDGRRVVSINPLFSFLNHSCEPNARWRQVDGGSTVVVESLKPIQRDEEICVDYRGVSQLKNKAARQRMLSFLLRGKKCECTRCQREN